MSLLSIWGNSQKAKLCVCVCRLSSVTRLRAVHIRRYVLKAVALWVGYPTGCVEVLVVSSFPVYLNAAVRACLCG